MKNENKKAAEFAKAEEARREAKAREVEAAKAKAEAEAALQKAAKAAARAEAEAKKAAEAAKAAEGEAKPAAEAALEKAAAKAAEKAAALESAKAKAKAEAAALEKAKAKAAKAEAAAEKARKAAAAEAEENAKKEAPKPLYTEIVSEWANMKKSFFGKPAEGESEGKLRRIDCDISEKLFHNTALYVIHYSDGTKSEAKEKPLSVSYSDISEAKRKEARALFAALRRSMEGVYKKAKVSEEKALSRKAREAASPALQKCIDFLKVVCGFENEFKVTNRDLWEVFHTFPKLSALLTEWEAESEAALFKSVFGLLRRRFMEEDFSFAPSKSFLREAEAEAKKKAAEKAAEKAAANKKPE